MSRVLIIEDDLSIRMALKRALTERGDAVALAPDAMSGLSLVVSQTPDVVLLDLGLPDLDGLSALKMLRGVSEVPVIVITAQDDDHMIVAALDAGADDYIVKPFGAAQVAARIRAVLRRSSRSAEPGDDEIVVDQLRIDARTRLATLDGQPLNLARKEFDLLFLLASHVGEVLSKRDLLAEVWQLPFGGADRTVDVHLSWLRRKLGETAAEPRYLHSVRGVGVRLVDPSQGET